MQITCTCNAHDVEGTAEMIISSVSADIIIRMHV